MNLYKSASFKMRGSLIKLMEDCFGESKSTVEFFLNNKPALKNCRVCVHNGEIVSALYALPSKILLNGKLFTANYIYGACTAENHRKKGYMKHLLKYSDAISEISGTDFSFLVPENSNLENFYKKLGFKNFFKKKTVILTSAEMKNISKNNFISNFESFSYSSMEKLHNKIYNGINGVVYNKNDLEYVARLYEKFGGKVVFSQNGYAVCSREEIQCVKVRGFSCRNGFEPCLLKNIQRAFPGSEKFVIETCPENNFFDEKAETSFFGMIKPLSRKANLAFKNFKKDAPYLEFALD